MPPSLNVVLAAIATMGQNLLGSDDELHNTPMMWGAVLIRRGTMMPWVRHRRLWRPQSPWVRPIATMGQNLLGSDDEVDDTPTQGGYDDVGGSFDQVGCSSSYIPYFFARCNVYICTYLYIFLIHQLHGIPI